MIRNELLAEEDDRVAGEPLRNLVRRAVRAHVALVVAAVAVGLRLDEGRALAGPGPFDRLCHDLQHSEHVVSIRDHTWHGVRGPADGDVLDRLVLVLTCEFTVEVVLAHVDDRQLPKRRQVERLVEGPLVRRAVAEERDRDAVRSSPPQLKRRAGCEWDATANDAVGTEEAELRVDHVQRAALRAVVAVPARIELRVHPFRVGTAREHVPVAPMRARDHVVGAERRAYAHRNSLLPDRRVQEAGDEAGHPQLRRTLLEAADQHEPPVEADELLRGQVDLWHARSPLLSDSKPSAGLEQRTGDVARIVRGEERHDGSDLLDGREPAHADLRQPALS